MYVGSYTLIYECPARSFVAEDTLLSLSISSTTISILSQVGIGEYHPSMSMSMSMFMFSLNYRRIITPGYQLVKSYIQQQ